MEDVYGWLSFCLIVLDSSRRGAATTGGNDDDDGDDDDAIAIQSVGGLGLCLLIGRFIGVSVDAAVPEFFWSVVRELVVDNCILSKDGSNNSDAELSPASSLLPPQESVVIGACSCCSPVDASARSFTVML